MRCGYHATHTLVFNASMLSWPTTLTTNTLRIRLYYSMNPTLSNNSLILRILLYYKINNITTKMSHI